jgi:RNA polymerase sigma-70 factor (ECF subfamily)
MTDTLSTYELLSQARVGDSRALEALFARYTPALKRWAHGRLPSWARDIADTDDMVQDALIRTFNRLDAFEYQVEGGLHAYLRQVLLNRIREELRKAGRRPASVELKEEMSDDGPTPLDAAIGGRTREQYEAALQRLRAEEREALIGRLEWGLSYKELADALGKPSADAARKAAQRALVRLIEEMGPPSPS